MREFFLDHIALNAHLCSLNLRNVYDNTFHLTTPSYLRIKQALTALVLGLKKRPVIRLVEIFFEKSCSLHTFDGLRTVSLMFLIDLFRYQRSSDDCHRLAEDLGQVGFNGILGLFQYCCFYRILLVAEERRVILMS